MSPRLAVVATTYQSTFAARILETLQHLTGPSLIARAAGDDPERQAETLRQLLRRDHPSALIAISIRPDAETIRAYRDRPAPVVLIDEEVPGAASVAGDNQEGGRLAADHLLSLGHREIAVISGRPDVPGGMNARQRLAGFEAVLAHHDLAPSVRIEVVQYSPAEGAEALLRLPAGCTAVFCAAGDMCATGLVRAARRRKLHVPGDLSVVGYDDVPVAEMSGLTTISQPIAMMAGTAYRMAVLDTPHTLTRPENVVYPPELVVRNSSAPAGEAKRRAS